MSERSLPSSPTTSATPVSASLIRSTFSARLERSRRTFGSRDMVVQRSVASPAKNGTPAGPGEDNGEGVVLAGLGGILGERAQLLERASQQARDLHLRNAHARCDLRLS